MRTASLESPVEIRFGDYFSLKNMGGEVHAVQKKVFESLNWMIEQCWNKETQKTKDGERDGRD